MTPEEAADVLSRQGVWAEPDPKALRVLIDHARATGYDAKSRGPEYWRGHADGKLEQQATTAPEIAERPVEIVTGKEGAERTRVEWRSAELMERFRHDLAMALNADETTGFPDLVNLVHVACKRYDELGLGRLSDYARARMAEHYATDRAPEPVAPPAVGDTVETAAQLDALPVGAVVRHPETFIVAVRAESMWSAARVGGDPEQHRDRLVELATTYGGLRVLDLGGA